jgi:hypothetical protein
METEDRFGVHGMKLLVVAVALCCLTGCSDRLRTYPVSGKVRFKSGEPVKVGTIELKSREHDIHARGILERDGTFHLTTYETGDGAIEGKHDCVLVQFVMTEGLKGHRPSTIGVVDRRYSSYASSGLTVDITPSKQNEVTIEVEGVRSSQPEGNHSH